MSTEDARTAVGDLHRISSSTKNRQYQHFCGQIESEILTILKELL